MLHAARDLATRYVDPRIPSILITLSSAIAVTLLSGTLTAIRGWTPVNGRQVALLAAASVFPATGYYLLIISLRAGEMSLIAPFRYTGLLFALLLGYPVWGDVPNAVAGRHRPAGGRRPVRAAWAAQPRTARARTDRGLSRGLSRRGIPRCRLRRGSAGCSGCRARCAG
ncbi:DMT family transporter [Ramlibacter terrae]|uniref:DMT family transporter n=1 Tax=Ramlibacter terrae TaxID=2732511 RepID=A0ABX6P462_9BURK|nr:DMT family transporter [Ramlibacter terrae]